MSETLRNIVHVIPMGDLKLHKETGNTCSCEPRVGENGNLIIHHAFDGRDFYESAKTAADFDAFQPMILRMIH